MSPPESLVNQMVITRMNKRRQMHWSPRGAYRVLQVRAGVLDGQRGRPVVRVASASPGF